MSYQFNLVDHVAGVTLVLEQSPDRFLSRLHVIQVSLQVLFLLLQLLLVLLNILTSLHCIHQSIQIIKFSLHPIIHFVIGILEIVDNMLHLFLQDSVSLLPEDQTSIIILHIGPHIHFLILVNQVEEGLRVGDRDSLCYSALLNHVSE